jgi:hypothetical protein
VSAQVRTDEAIAKALTEAGGKVGKAWTLLTGGDSRRAPGSFRDRCREILARGTSDPPPPPCRAHLDTEDPPIGDRVEFPLVSRVVVLPDIHAPYHDQRALDCALEAIQVLRPSGVLQIGDAADCYALSRFAKDPGRRGRAIEELEKAGELMRYISDSLPSTVKWKAITEGNHEARAYSYVRDKAPELDGMVRSVWDVLGMSDWRAIPISSYAQVGKMSYHHGWRHGIYAARQSLQDWGGNLTFGHTHRVAVWYGGTVRGEDHVAVNCGWLGDYNQIEYRMRATARRDWQHAISVQDFAEDGTVFAHVIPIVDGVTRVGLRTVRA